MNPQPMIAEDRHPRRVLHAGLTALMAIAALAGMAHAQELAVSQQPTSDVRIEVREARDAGQLISVPVNRGVLVDFNVPVREVRIANPDIADVQPTTPRQLLINGKSYGTTQLVVAVDGDVRQSFTVSVDLDLERLRASIRAIVPRAQVKVVSLLDSVVLTGSVPDIDAAERIVEVAGVYSSRVINHMVVAGVHQVLLRCTVAEVNRSATRQLGFNGWMAGDNFRDMFAVQQIGGINPVNIGAAADASVTASIPFLTDASGLGLSPTPTLSFGFPRLEMQLFIQALHENGLLQVLAEPNLVTISGQEATFLAGGEYPIPVSQRDSVTIQFREFGVRLKFTPTVLNNSAIRLRVAPEVSEPDYSTAVTLGGFTVPGLVQRKVETVVELGPGQTFAIGGLLSERARATSSKVPGLGDIPVLGALFKSTEYQSSQTELVVLVTPELVAPLIPNQIRYVPGADHIPPNDWELFGLGKLEGAAPEAGAADGAGDETWPVRQSELYGTSATTLRGPIGPAGENEGI